MTSYQGYISSGRETEFSIEILNEKWSFYMHYFLPEIGQGFFCHLFAFFMI